MEILHCTIDGSASSIFDVLVHDSICCDMPQLITVFPVCLYATDIRKFAMFFVPVDEGHSSDNDSKKQPLESSDGVNDDTYQEWLQPSRKRSRGILHILERK